MSEAEDLSPATHSIPEVDTWSIDQLKLKGYPHFDAPIRKKDIEALVQNPAAVAKHGFLPFLHFQESYVKFRGSQAQRRTFPNLQEVTTKTRPIRYACRADSYIYSRYRAHLVPIYEKQLSRYGLSESVVAYRKIPNNPSDPYSSNKSNIEIARDAFHKIKEMGDCLVVTADISSYFDNIDHSLLRKRWSHLLNLDKLPDDHAAVFRNITRYSWVDYKELCRSLGLFGNKGEREGFLINRKKMRIKIASNKKLRELLKSKDSHGKNLLQVNQKNRGIPQGSPISDILANLYLIEFDANCLAFAKKHNGSYFRYSDDILLIIRTPSSVDHHDVLKFLKEEISKAGPRLHIKDKKCACLQYKRSRNRQVFTPLSKTKNRITKVDTFKMRNGLEYLGFRYDGRKVFVRDSTISNLYRKIARNSVARAIQHRKNHPKLEAAELVQRMPFDDFYSAYGRVEDFDLKAAEADGSFKHLTFRSYAKRASEVFGEDGDKILGQFRETRAKAKRKLERSVLKAAEWYPAK